MINLIKSKLELCQLVQGVTSTKTRMASIIYVGKAKNLRNRVRSYCGSHDTKTEALVSEIVDLSLLLRSPEALLLENQPDYKENKPKYNIMILLTHHFKYSCHFIGGQERQGDLPLSDGRVNEIKRLLIGFSFS